VVGQDFISALEAGLFFFWREQKLQSDSGVWFMSNIRAVCKLGFLSVLVGINVVVSVATALVKAVVVVLPGGR